MKKLILLALAAVIMAGCSENETNKISKKFLYEIVTDNGVDTVKSDEYYISSSERYFVFRNKVGFEWEYEAVYPSNHVKRVKLLKEK